MLNGQLYTHLSSASLSVQSSAETWPDTARARNAHVARMIFKSVTPSVVGLLRYHGISPTWQWRSGKRTNFSPVQ